jgi:hypothetical protein
MVAISLSISTLQQSGDANLVDHLGQLAGARLAQKIAGTRVSRDHLLGAAKGLIVAAAHYREDAVLGAGLAARHRRIDGIEAAFFGRGVKLAGNVGRGGGVVDKNLALAHAGEGAIGAESHFAQVVIVADAAHDEILALGRGFGRGSGFAAELRHPFLGLGGGAVIDGHLVSALGLEMPGHGVAHDA